MFDCDVSMVQQFTFAQKAAYVTPRLHLVLVVRGMEWLRLPGVERVRPEPYLHLCAPGTPVAFEFDDRRENWVVQLETDAVRPAETADAVEIRCDGAWIRIPAFAEVPREHVAGWQGEFLRMRDAFRDPHPRSRLRVRVGVANALRYLLDRQPDTLGGSPAGRFKRRIAEDERCERSLDALSRECGYTADHLRKLFVREFGVTPQVYRARQRMARAVALLGNSDLAVKEVARATGFRHTSHFSTLFRQAYGITPREAIRRYREGGETMAEGG